MTRIKKRRSGKKRTADRRKASAGRRGRAAKNADVAKEKKEGTENSAVKELSLGKKEPVTQKTSGKARSAGARRVAVAKSVANVFKPKAAVKKITATGAGEETTEKPAKGFAPWNKNKFKPKNKKVVPGNAPGKKRPVPEKGGHSKVKSKR